MKESNFQFKNPILTKLNYQLNNDFDEDNFEKIEMKLYTEVTGEINEKQAIVKLRGEIGETNKSSPFYIELEMESYFKWDDDISEETLKQLLKRNGSALLLSYMRPIVTFVTSQSGIIPYNMPYIDFTRED